MTYNFDPDRWYNNEQAVLEREKKAGRLTRAEYQAALADLDRRYEKMLDRLDGTYQIPKGEGR